MRLLISDANILIDMEAGALMETLFQLPMQFGIPDLLYYEEIEPGSPGLEELGLQVMEVSGDFVAYAEQLPGQHNHLSPVDPLLLQANVLPPALLLEIPIELLLLLRQKRQFRCWMLRRFIHPQRLVSQQGVFVHEHGLQRWNV